MKSKQLLTVFFLFASILFVNAQTKEPKEPATAPEMSTGLNAAEVSQDTPKDPNGKVIVQQKSVALSNEKVSATTNGKSTTPPKKKIGLVKTGKVATSK